MTRLIIFVLSCALTLSGLPKGYAVEWSEGDRADIKSAETFLNDLGTYQAEFIQVSPDGNYSAGWIWVQRPRYLRVEYAPPNNLLLVADGTYLIFIDRDIEQISRYSYESGPFRFLLKEDVDLTKDMIVQAVHRVSNLLHITLVDEDDFEAGSVTLSFAENPMQLAGWTVTDPDGHLTTVTLHNSSHGLKLHKKFFRYTEFDKLRKDYRYGVYD
ncbi:MAG: outer membrane lipoprotein carrier protein LolA [Pseudomonadota bacterium]|nr:outer membrane lipoprotein carrier protein LolA [Pseudomonadota bacterium]